jgi:translation initiation factor 1 (eIF-1/SUI1)
VSHRIRKNRIEARPEEDRILAGATVNAPGAELANSSHTHECVVGSQFQAFDLCSSAGNGAFGGISFCDLLLRDAAPGCDGSHVDVLTRRRILISVHKVKKKRGEGEVTKVEGIPDNHDLCDLLKKLKAKNMLSCGGHVAEDKATRSKFLVLQGSFSAQVARFLTREGVASADCIERRG